MAERESEMAQREPQIFANRADAGRRLAARLTDLPRHRLVVLGLPRGGVPVAYQIADALRAPLDVIMVRKLGVPNHPEYAMGAIGEGDVRIVDHEIVRRAGVDASDFAAVEARERHELARRAARFRGQRERVPLGGCTALIVDDGIATGSTVRAACQVARVQGAARVILAAPVAPGSAIESLRSVADEVIVLSSPEPFYAIGQFYEDFSQTSDEEVVRLLERARSRDSGPVPGTGVRRSGAPGRDEDVVVRAGAVPLGGHLTVPPGATGIVLFAHGSGSSRHSARNQLVAEVLNRSGVGTLLFDLLTSTEERDRNNVFDIELLAGRLVAATQWLRGEPEGCAASIGYFGASTGAAAALWASTDPGVSVAAVVSRGGRPDLAGPRLGAVRAPTLLIVGSQDHTVLDLNRQAAAQMHCETVLKIVPGATHLFEEPGTLASAAVLARDWFVNHLSTVGLNPVGQTAR